MADKATYVLYGFAMIAILRVTNEIELGVFTLFNYLHNIILNISDSFSLQAILQFSAEESEKPRVNTIAMFNHIIVVSLFVALAVIFKNPIADILKQPKVVYIVEALPILALISIPRYFCARILYREMKIFRLFLTNLTYFGSMSLIIFYCIFTNFFLNYSSIINITYIGAGFSAIISFILTYKYWKFSLKGKTKYVDVLKFSLKYTITGIIMPLPKYCDVFLIQYFYGTAIVGLYSPAKTIFRFVDEAINTAYSLIYVPSVKLIAKNDIKSLNSLITKAISFLFIGFTCVTIFGLLGGNNWFSVFLPDKFAFAIPFFNVLMISSVLLPITLLNTTISASGKPEVIAKFVLISFPFWLAAFFITGVFFNSQPLLIPLPYVIFLLILSILFFRYASKHFNFKFHQLFRAVPDTLNFIKNRLNL